MFFFVPLLHPLIIGPNIPLSILHQSHSPSLCSFYSLQAKELEDLFKESNTSSGSAIDAANAYSNIETAIQEAHIAAQDAGSAAENATDLSQGLDERTGESGARSSELLQIARETLDQAQRELLPHLEKARNSVEEVRQMNIKSNEGDSRINRCVHRRESV